MNRYTTLVRILDGIRSESRNTAFVSRYAVSTSELDAVWQARARAYIHLYLKVMFGIFGFEEREKFITDGTQDGGIDGYYIDHDTRIIYLLQSKFRNSEPLTRVAGVLGRWGDDTELSTLLDVIRALYRQADESAGGLVIYLNVRSYPAVLIFWAYGLGLVRAERWSSLHQLFTATLGGRYRDAGSIVDNLFLWNWKGTENDAWKQIEGLQTRKTPLSDHLLALFSDWKSSFVGTTPDFEMIVDRLEVLGALSCLERRSKAEVQAELNNGAQTWVWMPVGRWSWNRDRLERLMSELQAEPAKSKLMEAGFAQGDGTFFDLFATNIKRTPSRLF